MDPHQQQDLMNGLDVEITFGRGEHRNQGWADVGASQAQHWQMGNTNFEQGSGGSRPLSPPHHGLVGPGIHQQDFECLALHQQNQLQQPRRVSLINELSELSKLRQLQELQQKQDLGQGGANGQFEDSLFGDLLDLLPTTSNSVGLGVGLGDKNRADNGFSFFPGGDIDLQGVSGTALQNNQQLKQQQQQQQQQQQHTQQSLHRKQLHLEQLGALSITRGETTGVQQKALQALDKRSTSPSLPADRPGSSTVHRHAEALTAAAQNASLTYQQLVGGKRSAPNSGYASPVHQLTSNPNSGEHAWPVDFPGVERSSKRSSYPASEASGQSGGLSPAISPSTSCGNGQLLLNSGDQADVQDPKNTLKEKNREAQRRYRERQRSALSTLQIKTDEQKDTIQQLQRDKAGLEAQVKALMDRVFMLERLVDPEKLEQLAASSRSRSSLSQDPSA